MAAAMAAIAANTGGETLNRAAVQGKGLERRAFLPFQLPPGPEWIKSGQLFKMVTGNEVQWHERRIVLTVDAFCITRPGSNDVVERMELRTIQDIRPYVHNDEEAGNNRDRLRRASTCSVESVLKNGHSGEKKTNPNDKPALQFKTVDEQGTKRKFFFGASSQSELLMWMEALKSAVTQAEKRHLSQDWWGSLSYRLKKQYDGNISQTIVASLIIGNFAMAIVKAQLVPEPGSSTDETINSIEILFTALFTVELLINMLANFFTPFWKDWWNISDFIIVFISIIAIPLNDGKGFNLLRMMRVFRVIRVFNSLKALKTIIHALTSAIIPVSNAFAVLAVATAIYAVIGVGLYADMDPIQFGDFKRAIFTMFQVITGDSWATTIARPMFNESQDPSPSVTLFFASYILIVGTFLLNVVVAVLLDEFISSVQIGKAEERKKNLNKRKTANHLDPLLMSFGACDDTHALSAQINAVYQVLDADDSGGLSFEEFRDGLPRLDTYPIIYLSPEDFDDITEGGTLCDSNGELDAQGFETLIRRQLKAYAQRRATFEMIEGENSNSAVAAVILMTKQVMMDLEAVHLKVDGLCSSGGGSPSGSIFSPQAPKTRPGSMRDSKFGRAESGSTMATASRRFTRVGSGSDKSETREREGGVEMSAGRDETATIYRMDKKLSRLYSKLHSLHEVVTRDGGGGGRSRQRGTSGGKGQSRDRQDDGWDREDRADEDWDARFENGGRGGETDSDEDEEAGKTQRKLERRRGRNEGGRGAENLEAYEMPSTPGSALEAVMSRLDGIERRIGDMGRDQRALTTRLERKIDTLTRQQPSSRGALIADASGAGEVEGFIGAAATQLMMGGMATGPTKALRKDGRTGSGAGNMLTKMLAPKNRRGANPKDKDGSPDGNYVTGELTFEPKGKRWENGAGRGNDARMPSFMVKGSGEPIPVRVSWLCSPALSPASVEPPEEVACEGCHRCHNGYIGVGCLVCGDKLVMIANTEDLLGNEHQTAGPDVLAVMGQGLLRRHGHHDKAVDASKFVDTPHGDGRHWFRCYLLLGLAALPEPPYPPQDDGPKSPRHKSPTRSPKVPSNRRGSTTVIPRMESAPGPPPQDHSPKSPSRRRGSGIVVPRLGSAPGLAPSPYDSPGAPFRPRRGDTTDPARASPPQDDTPIAPSRRRGSAVGRSGTLRRGGNG